ncbi:MAG: ATP-binding cassette domain-containing protein [Clostridia bacterium]|nr:ATP-binding cassette domain-containing protein [Clostridia bacterium]
MIEIQNVSKRYGDKWAVKDVSFTINKGEVLGFLGRNGAGKSTTMNIVTGYISATSGRVLLDGYDILENPREVKRHIGYLPEIPPLYIDMTVDEYLRFVCSIKEVETKHITNHVNDICELIRIQDHKKRLIKNLSKGYKQRVGMAQALIGNPEIVIMDEPTVGLDPKQIIEIRHLIKELGEDHTVVLSSHILPEVADVCERLVIINKGQIVAQDTLENLTRGISDTFRFRLRIAGPERDAQKAIREIPGLVSIDSMGSKEPDTCDFLIESDRQVDIRRPLFNVMSKLGYPILMLRPMDLELEDIFLQLTSDTEEVL